MNIIPLRIGRYEAPWADEISLSPKETILGGASGYTGVDIDWDEYWGDGDD